MSVLQRKDLEESPLADLHAIASEIGLEGYRALRREDLIGAILEAQGEEEGEPAEQFPAEEAVATDAGIAEREDEQEIATEAGAVAPEPESGREEPAPPREERTVSGVLDVLSNGSGFLRVDPAGQSRDDVYVSPAQIRRCELRAGDEVSGPMRPPRRTERHPSLVRVEQVNGAEAEPPQERARFRDLTPVFPTERLAAPPLFDSAPFGKGSRVAIGGPPGAGATTVLRQVAATLGEGHPAVGLTVVLVGVRPEEVTEWKREVSAPVYGGGLDGSLDAQVQAAELAIERAKRTVERGGDAAVILDTLEVLPHGAARRIFGAARSVEEGGSLTVVAATGMAWEPQRLATTRVVLEPPTRPGAGPSIAAGRSATLRSELLS